MKREQVEHALKPIWLGFAAAEARLMEMLEESKAQTMDRMNALEKMQHEDQIEQALSYVKARARAFIGDHLYQAIDTGRGVITWPNVYPASDAAALAVAMWKESRALSTGAGNVEPLRREA